MTVTRCAKTIFLQGCQIQSCWRNLRLKRADSLHRSRVNLELTSPGFRKFSRWMSTDSSLPDEDVKRFLRRLTIAYRSEERTKFDQLFQQQPVIAQLLQERIQYVQNIESLKELEIDEQLKDLGKEEKLAYEKKIEEIDDELIKSIANSLDEDYFNDVIFELTTGVGGQESMLFVKDLLEMYIKHFDYLGYDYEIADVDEASQGAIRHASIMVSGNQAYAKLRHEAGVHRVQRVPATERSGRIHTSVVSVAVLPQPSEIEVEINPKDLRIDTMRASGAGGQHVNTTESAVRITHIPTGFVAECQTQRSQLKNRSVAMAKLRAKIYQDKLEKQMKNATSLRKQQIGLGLRHEKIRTYNYNQDRVTDHRLSNGTMHNLKGFLEGGEMLDQLHTKLDEDSRRKLLLEIIRDV